MFAEQSVLSDQTLISLGTAFAVLTPIALGFGWLQGKLNKIDKRLEAMELNGQETWSYSQMEAWVLRFQRQEPNVKIPDPKRNIRQVERGSES